jgi:hypothetical protein
MALDSSTISYSKGQENCVVNRFISQRILIIQIPANFHTDLFKISIQLLFVVGFEVRQEEILALARELSCFLLICSKKWPPSVDNRDEGINTTHEFVVPSL